MLNDAFVGTLPVISYRIATEPNFIQKLKSQIEKRMLDSGQVISEDEASALLAYLDSELLSSQAISKLPEGSGQLDLWIG